MTAIKVAVVILALSACKGSGKDQPPVAAAGDLFVDPQVLDLPVAKLPTLDGRTLRLPLTVGAPIEATRTNLVPRGANDFSWFGRTPRHGFVVISSVGGDVIGMVIEGVHTYRIVQGPDGRFRIGLVKPRRRLGHGSETMKHGDLLPVLSEDGPIEVIAAYTTAASKSCKPILATIQNAVDVTNTIAKESGLTTTFHLVATYNDKSYDEEKYSMKGAVEWFAGTKDGELDDIHDRRKQARADIAILFIHKDRAKNMYDGFSKETTAHKETAFSVVDCDDVAAVDFTLAHEIGHLLGLNDDSDDPNSSTYKDGFGYVHDREDPEDSWRTVMAMDATCVHDCPRIMRWSNPSVRFPESTGDPTGVAGTSDNARVIRSTAGAISQFAPRP